MFVKICGVTSVEDAVACIEAGADAIGFNLWPRSKRYRPITTLAAAAAAAKGKVERFGVFVNASAEDIEAAFAADVIDFAQLQGDEEPDVCARFSGRFVKALRLSGRHSLDDIDRYDCARLLVDAPFAGYGGSGQLIDEPLATLACAHARSLGRGLILAGGLDPENVAAIVHRIHPAGVDVASGVERSPGIKDHDRVRRFVTAARSLPDLTPDLLRERP